MSKIKTKSEEDNMFKEDKSSKKGFLTYHEMWTEPIFETVAWEFHMIRVFFFFFFWRKANLYYKRLDQRDRQHSSDLKFLL